MTRNIAIWMAARNSSNSIIALFVLFVVFYDAYDKPYKEAEYGYAEQLGS